MRRRRHRISTPGMSPYIAKLGPPHLLALAFAQRGTLTYGPAHHFLVALPCVDWNLGSDLRFPHRSADRRPIGCVIRRPEFHSVRPARPGWSIRLNWLSVKAAAALHRHRGSLRHAPAAVIHHPRLAHIRVSACATELGTGGSAGWLSPACWRCAASAELGPRQRAQAL